MDSEKLTQAVHLIKTGNKQAAISLLRNILQENPKNEDAWLWLYACVNQVEQKKYCLQKALEINPGNQGTQNALRKLTDPPAQLLQSVPLTKVTSPQPVSQIAAKPATNRLPWILTSVAMLLLISCLVVVFILVQNSQMSAIVTNLPFASTATPTASLTFTPTFTATFTLTPTATPTRRPTWTPIPVTNTPIPSPTIAPFTPGNPTSTPWGSDITDSNFQKGLKAYQAQNFADVINLMGQVIDADPDLVPPYRYRGMAYWYLGDCLSGMDDAEKAVAKDPNYAAGWAARGVLNNCLGNDQQALEDYQKALSLDPSLAFVHQNLGVYYFNLGDYEKSLQEYNLSLAIDPNRAEAMARRNDVFAQLGRFDECITNANEMLRANQQDWSAYASRGYCELLQKNFTDAIKDYKIFLAKTPDDSIASYNLGIAYSGRGDAKYEEKKYTAAIADYKQAISLVPNNGHDYCLLADSYFRIKQYQTSIDWAEISKKVDPDCGGSKLLEIEGRAYFALGNYDKGIELLNESLDIGPYKLGYYYRGIMYQTVGEKEKAIDDFEYFLFLGYVGPEADDAKARLAKLKQ